MPEMHVQAVQHFDNSPLAVNEFTIHSDPERFVLDFKSLVPEFAPGGGEPVMMVAHKTLVLEPFLAKQLIAILQQQVTAYEKNFGEIKRSAAALKAQKAQKRAKQATASVERPHYMG